MKTVYRLGKYEVRKINDRYYPIQIIGGDAYGVGRDRKRGLSEIGPSKRESAVRVVASPRVTKTAAIATIRRAAKEG